MTTRGLIGVAVCGATYQLPAGLAGAVTDLAVVCAASALATVAPGGQRGAGDGGDGDGRVVPGSACRPPPGPAMAGPSPIVPS